MKQLIYQCLFILLATIPFQNISGQNANETFEVSEVYKQVYLEFGSLDENGDPIDYVFEKSQMEVGEFNVVIRQGPGNLYEITGTSFYITFTRPFVKAEFGKECKLIVREGYKNIKVILLP